MSYPNVLLANNRDISQRAFEQADGLRREIASAVECREGYVAEHQLDPSFCLPDSNWGRKTKDPSSTFLTAYRYVRDGNYHVLNRLRFWAPYFSGYEIMWLEPRRTDRPSVAAIRSDHDKWIRTNRSEPDEWVGLWVKYAKTVPPALRFSPPWALGEIGWLVDGIVVNHDTYVYQERINLLYETGIIDWLRRLGRAPRILEIGGGYGALAFALRRILPSACYAICDLPESLMFSGLYLTLCEQDETRLIASDDEVSTQPFKGWCGAAAELHAAPFGQSQNCFRSRHQHVVNVGDDGTSSPNLRCRDRAFDRRIGFVLRAEPGQQAYRVDRL